MSWDISICKFSRTYACIADIPDDEKGCNLGARSEVRAAVSAHFPLTDWTDPAWGIYEAAFGSVEFSIGPTDPVKGMMLHVRASEAIVAPIVKLCLEQGWQALDMGSNGFLEQVPVPEAGLRDWLAYRNQVLGVRGA